ncbi:class I SAM-dependent methyltransferase [Acidimicrobiia bacterium]|nr:class I SAM-dependent methyltransferase [Candidatus Actinomarina sp.]MDA9845137.1 class I SAM-dependent methyltransferase [Acidimicrobiia bacterium]|tara:strand:+ start:145 stop:855 length:711 start_codon:yes stop_codon:yes gene_type:complete
MSNFWNEELNSGYYDLILENGLKRKRSIQANWHNITLLKISKFLKKDTEHLDYACGPGTLIGKYSKANSLGVDLSDKQITYAKNKYGERNFVYNKDFDFNKYQNQFDVISIIGLFEFLSDKEILDLLTNLKIMLKPAGKIVASTLNFNSYLKILLYFQYSFGKVNYKNEHINHIEFTKMQNLLERTDYSSFKIEKFMNIGVSFSIFKNSLGVKAHDFIEKLFNKNFGALIFIELNN